MLRAVPLTEHTPPPHPSAPHSGEPRPARLRRGWLVALVGSLLLHVAMREIWSVWEQRQPAKIELPKAIEVTLTPPPPPVEPPKPVSPPPAPPPPPKPKPVVKPMVKPVQPIAAEVPKPRPVPPPKPTPPPKPKPLPKPPKPKPPPEPEPAPRELDDLAPPEEFKEPEPEPKPKPIRRRIREPIPEPPREPAVEPEAEPEPPAEVKAPPRPAPPPPAPVKAEPATAAASPEPAARPRSDQDTSRHRPSAETATGGQNSAPVVIARPKPRYPGIAQQRHWEGRVLVRLKVSANGEPSDCEVAESSGHDILDEAARDSVCENWRFKPALRDGKPVDYQATQPVVFKLE